jgi:molybdopterin-containing oxidoreductase family membrane subunit
MTTPTPPGARLLVGRWDDASLTDKLLEPIHRPAPAWKAVLLVTGLGTGMLFLTMGYVFATGIGVFGNNIPVAWGFPIINFVWWIGIGHAGTFISAVLLLLEQPWRSSLNRIAEGMTLFAVVQAGMYPVLHLGRPWFAYWLVPYPSTMSMWPQFMSALTWDMAAISTYFTISLLFWYQGLVPDLASARDRARTERARKVYGFFALGWRNSAWHWRHWRRSQLLLAGLATPLVLSVHSIVSMDFATSKLPGWHSLIFPPYFVAGAIFSGFAMVITLVVPLRRIYHLKEVITPRHLDLVAKLTLVTSLVVSYSYASEFFIAWYGGVEYERFTLLQDRPFGPYAAGFWTMIACNVFVPQLLWSRRVRANTVALWVVSIFVNIGMWFERFVLIVTSQHADFLPSSWGDYAPSLVDWMVFLGTISFFLFLFTLLIRFVPFVPISENKELLHHMGVAHEPEHR